MILKVENALKTFRRTDPDCEARRDLRGSYLPAGLRRPKPLATARRQIPRHLSQKVQRSEGLLWRLLRRIPYGAAGRFINRINLYRKLYLKRKYVMKD